MIKKEGMMKYLSKIIFISMILFQCLYSAEYDWLQWGGKSGKFIVNSENIVEVWREEGPNILWKHSLGDAYSSIITKGEKLFTTYSLPDSEIVVSLSKNTGKTIWEYKYPRKLWDDMRPDFGLGPNATPLLFDDNIISIGIAGDMKCLNIDNGNLIWERNLNNDYGRRERVEEYGYSNSPLRYKNCVIVHAGGDKISIIAIDPNTGKNIWESPGSRVSYGQPSIIHIAGKDQFVYFTHEGVNGLDPNTGKFLWHFKIPISNGNHLTPVVKCDENHLYVASQFNRGGGRLLHISDEMKVTEKWFNSKLQTSCWTLIRQGDYIYGSSGNHNVSHLTVFNWKTDEITYREKGHYMAQMLYADEKFIFLDIDGNLHIATASPKGFEVKCSAKVAEKVCWTLPTLVGSKLYIRDRKSIMAIDLAKEN